MVYPQAAWYMEAMVAPESIVRIEWGTDGAFSNDRWTLRRGEQWVVTGPNGSGKTTLALLLTGVVPPIGCSMTWAEDVEERAALVTFSQQELLASESWLQARWHAGIDHPEIKVRQFLSFEEVNDINPFEVRGDDSAERRVFGRRRRRTISQLNIKDLLSRSLHQLSNGETRKILIARALLQGPRLLVLDDPFAGLDTAARANLQEVLARLAENGLPMVLMVRRADEIPRFATHRLLVDALRIVRRRRLKSDRKTKPEPRTYRLSRPDFKAIEAPIIEMRDVTIRYGRRVVMDNLSWTVRRGERWLLTGPNGSGKTTLLSLITGDNPAAYAHDIRVFGHPRGAAGQSIWEVRGRIGQVSTEIHCHFDTDLSCLDTVLSGRFDENGAPVPARPGDERTALKLLREMGIHDAASQFSELSHGQQQLVLLARAVLPRPALLLLDEPCLNLDTTARKRVLRLLERLLRERVIHTLIYSAHHPDDVPRGLDHMLSLDSVR